MERSTCSYSARVVPPLVISAAGLLLNDSDVDGDALSIASFTQPANGTVEDNGDGSLTYTPAANFTGTDSFSYTISDGAGETTTATVTVTVGSTNDAPIVDLNGPAGGIDFADTFTEGGGAVLIADPVATVSDVDSATLASLTVTISNVQDGAAEVLSADATGTSVAVAGNGTGTLTLSAGADLAEYQQVLRTITYENTLANPTLGVRTIEVVADDGSGSNNLSPVATSSITVSAVNDAPAVALPGGALAYTENDGAVAIDAAATVSDPDSGDFAGGSLSVSLTANGTVSEASVALSASLTVAAAASAIATAPPPSVKVSAKSMPPAGPFRSTMGASLTAVTLTVVLAVPVSDPPSPSITWNCTVRASSEGSSEVFS